MHRHELVGEQLVAALHDGLRRIQDLRAGHLELPHDGGAVGGNRDPDARYDEIVGGERLALVMHRAGDGLDVHVAAQRVDGLDNVVARLGRLDQAAVREVAGLHGQERDPQRAPQGRRQRPVRINVEAQLVLQIFGPGADIDRLRLKRAAAEQHPVRHGMPVRKRYLDRPFPPARSGSAY